MRVIAGTAGGIRLLTPEGTGIRPTSDRARESIFNSLHSRSAIQESEVLDLFAGTGALGIEALSRGAKKATFVDNSPESLELVKENLKIYQKMIKGYVEQYKMLNIVMSSILLMMTHFLKKI